MSIYSLKNSHRVLAVLLVSIMMLLTVIPPVQAGPPTQVPKSEIDDVVYGVLLDVYNEMSEPDLSFGDPIPSNAFAQVERMYLFNRGISSLSGFNRFSFTALKELSMSGNRLTSLAGFPTDVPALEMLSLSNNRLTTLTGLPASLSRLTELNLSGNALTSLGTMPQSLPVLKQLDLSENVLSGAQAFAGIPRLPELSELSVSDNGLTSLSGMPPATKIPTMQVLELGSNALTTLTGMPDYSDLPLEICDLFNNQITTLVGFDHLRNASSNNNGAGLTLNIGGNTLDLTSSQNQALAQNLPGVVFVSEMEPSSSGGGESKEPGSSGGEASESIPSVTEPGAVNPGGDNTLYNKAALQALNSVSALQRESAQFPGNGLVVNPDADAPITLTALDGIKLTVPPSALAAERAPLKFKVAVGDVKTPPKAERTAVVLNPLKYQRQYSVEGKVEDSTEFLAPVTLIFPINSADLPLGVSVKQLAVYGWDPVRGDWIKRGGVLDTAANTLSLPTYHLSTYAVMADTSTVPLRISGVDRFATANAVAEQGWKAGADTVILANAYSFPDALAATPLAFKHQAPVLLTEADRLTAPTLAEMQKLAPKRIILVGGTAVISQNIQDNLCSHYGSANVVRYAGVDRYATAGAIATALGTTGKAVVLAGGDANFPDALAISSYAGYYGIPILFSQGDSIPTATQQGLIAQKVTSTIVVGGTAVVPESVLDQLPGATRYGGIDQYETATIIASQLNMNLNHIYVATGLNFPDALVAGAMASQSLAPILMVDQGVPSSVSTFLSTNKSSINDLTEIGGEAVITPKQDALLQGCLQ